MTSFKINLNFFRKGLQEDSTMTKDLRTVWLLCSVNV